MVIRAKKLGVLIQDARLATGKSVDQCAEAIGVTPSKLTAYEYGDASPSLPELEVLAIYLDVPLSHFWGNRSISEDDKSSRNFDQKQLVNLRQRVVGTLIRQARTEADMSLDDLAERVGISESQLETYELGQSPIPLPLLEALIAELDLPIQDFRDKQGPVGEWSTRRHAIHDFLELPPEMQMFVALPVNRPYLELAKRLSEMPVDSLRLIGEGILEITL
jgi:transcriptional regulator with XRE-family HTH domain